ncbi:YkuS family protein [Paenibacillus silviterrae]|uniref:YkuS family protein n=1 Tax=Paenibacillus silviterrae TaxID=3242194 RepID=UPI00254276C7|nr:YkuS family protein [Paenibacillus chinjuensis]
MAKIAVEDSLNNVKDALKQNGYDVVSLDNSSIQNCDCCVISGQDKNVMGMTETVTRASVINAQGMSESEIVKQVSQRCELV